MALNDTMNFETNRPIPVSQGPNFTEVIKMVCLNYICNDYFVLLCLYLASCFGSVKMLLCFSGIFSLKVANKK